MNKDLDLKAIKELNSANEAAAPIRKKLAEKAALGQSVEPTDDELNVMRKAYQAYAVYLKLHQSDDV